jgi:hypothetical protein
VTTSPAPGASCRSSPSAAQALGELQQAIAFPARDEAVAAFAAHLRHLFTACYLELD